MNWETFFKVAGSLLGVVATWALARWTEKRPKLIAYYGHAGSCRLPIPDPREPPQFPPSMNMHSVVIRNVGKKSATNVRVSHHYLPTSFSIWPIINHRVEPVPGTADTIVFPVLVPGQQVTINYLYFPPLTLQQVTGEVQSDEGLARVIDVLPTPLLGTWQIRALRVVLFAGAVTLIYLTYVAVAALARFWELLPR